MNKLVGVLSMLLSVKLFTYLGMPIAITYIVFIGVMILAFQNRIDKRDLLFFGPLLFVLIIDKSKDLIHSVDLGFIVPIVFYFLLLSVFLQQRYGEYLFNLSDRKGALVVLLVTFITFSISYRGNFVVLDRELSSIALFAYFILDWRYRSTLITLVIFGFLYYVTESRSDALALIVYVIFTRLKITNKSLTIGYLVLIIFLVPIAAIYWEVYFIDSVSIEFTGRGLIWNQVYEQIRFGGWLKFMLGADASSEALKALSEDLSFGGSTSQLMHMRHILAAGNFHNGLFFTLFNSGMLGAFLLIATWFKIVVKVNFTVYKASFYAFLIVYIFNGRSIGSLYIDSIILNVLMIISYVHRNSLQSA